MPTGFIQVFTRTVEGAEPVALAAVTVFKTVASITVYSNAFTTDEDGYSDQFAVETPSASISLDEFSSALPYSTYDLTATADGFLPASISGIQCFEGQTSIVTVEFIPQNSVRKYNIIDTEISIEPHSLYTGKGGSGKAPLVTCDGGFVLTNPIIPNKIRVHLDKPNTPARNVTVNFRDYVKNVASSEVYPTWPVECLKANIYAQISIALNRIYTEWYISKGFVGFDITGSPAYDQKFAYGRNIFDNISKLVDEIFNTYIRRPSFIEPYFAQYCDGKTVTCSGMKQWGSVTQAQSGKNALQILKFYYGNNLELFSSNVFADIKESYAGTTLQIGSSGEQVKIIQRQLNRIAKNYPFFGTIPNVNGVYDTNTSNIVKKFQKQFSLAQDGKVGKSTWYKISYIYVAVKKLAQLTSEGEKDTGVTPPEGSYGGTVLRTGSQGSAVRSMQFYLNEVAGFVNGIPTLTVDGNFGNGTNASVIAFQTYYGLTPDGLVGKVTWDKIYAEYNSLQSDIIPPTQQFPEKYPGTAMSQGSSSNAVKTFQFWLSIISYKYSTIPRINADGNFGPATKSAVVAFQSYFFLTADGVVGKATWDKIYEVYSDSYNSIVPPNARPGVYPGTPLRQGSNGAAVKEMQFYLFILSAYYSTIPKIAYDGFFGAATTTAVKAFQRLFSLNADGVVGSATWTKLYGQFTKLRSVDGPVINFSLEPYPGYNLMFGSTGDMVVELQLMLSYISEYVEIVQAVEQDGVFGGFTIASVLSYQEAVGLPQTGIVDEETWTAIVISYKTALSVYELATFAEDGVYPGYVLKLGSIGPAVQELQTLMNIIASQYCSTFFVPETGLFETLTEMGVIKFQEGFSLPTTGIVDKETWDTIINYVGV